MASATATVYEMQNNFIGYLGMAMGGKNVSVTLHGKEVARLVPGTASREIVTAPVTESLTGILKLDIDLDEAKEERMRQKYEIAD